MFYDVKTCENENVCMSLRAEHRALKPDKLVLPLPKLNVCNYIRSSSKCATSNLANTLAIEEKSYNFKSNEIRWLLCRLWGIASGEENIKSSLYRALGYHVLHHKKPLCHSLALC